MDNENDPLRHATGPVTGPRHEPVFNLAPVVTVLALICVAIHAVRSLWLDPVQQTWVLLHLAFIPLRYTGGYPLDISAFVSPLSYSFLHGGMAHLIVNMVWLAAFGSPLANRIGTARFVAFWAATALAAVGLHFALYPTSASPLVGASGAISGMMGAAARFAFRVDRRQRKPAFAGPILPYAVVLQSRTVLAFLAVWMVINLAVGLGSTAGGPQIAWEAHIGGFLVGFFGIRFFDRPTASARKSESIFEKHDA